jgi:hypothetical protein
MEGDSGHVAGGLFQVVRLEVVAIPEDELPLWQPSGEKCSRQLLAQG